jgi:antirestriction protein ArdC
MKAYSLFHNYSLSNQIAAFVQCRMRKIEPSPIHTYKGWQNLKRQVKKGEKALWLCMPLTAKRQNNQGDDEQFIKTFVWKPHWFALSQTEGEPVENPILSNWDKGQALSNLEISEIAFDDLNGNTQGYATKRSIAISPIAQLPYKTLFHELAHVVLGHTFEKDFQDDEHIPKNLMEVEAESVAMLLCESLGLPGSEYCRGYIQHWLKGDSIPEKSAQKIFGAADRILRAGKPEQY